MKKPSEFDDILEECLERLLVMGETMEQCLQNFPEQADELKPLLETVLAVRDASAIQPRPQFRDRARYQLYAALPGVEPEKRRPVFAWRPLWTTVVAVVLVLLLAGGGTVLAAAGSMPDEALYPVKLATEQARLVFTPSTLGKAELYARLADRRVLEIMRMADEGKPEEIERTTRRLDAQLTKIAELASPQLVAGSVPQAMLAERAAPETEEAAAPEPAPAAGRAPLAAERGKEGKELGTAGNPQRARLRATVTRDATNQTARLRALLERVPASARPALLRAIAVSETGYRKALESLD